MTELEDWLTASQAAEVISRNSGKRINASYVRQLARYGKLTPHALNTRVSLYPREQVERIIVEGRGGKHEQKHTRSKQASEKAKIMLIDSDHRSKKA